MRPGVVVALAAAVLLAGCATEQEIVQEQENMLAAAGFSLRPASTPEREAELKSLPPHQFVYREKDGKLTYTYADPTFCNCMYVGSEEAYQRYRLLVLQKQIADQQLRAAQMAGWNWGMWGPPPGWW